MTHDQLLESLPTGSSTPIHPVPGLSDNDVGGSSTAICDPERGTGALSAGDEQSVPARVDHPFLCDQDGDPDAQGDFDCYDLGVLIKVVDRKNTPAVTDDEDKIFGRMFRFRVENPKSPDDNTGAYARIVSIEPLDPTAPPVLILSRPVVRITTSTRRTIRPSSATAGPRSWRRQAAAPSASGSRRLSASSSPDCGRTASSSCRTIDSTRLSSTSRATPPSTGTSPFTTARRRTIARKSAPPAPTA